MRSPVNALGKYSPHHQHQYKPKYGEHQERNGLYKPEIEQYGRADCKHVHEYQQDSYLGPREKVVSQRLKNLFFVVRKADRHACKIRQMKEG